ncbi:cytoplasmic protein [Armillaria luteobubalina]|uniref:Cytoplasmic protein n=1 Tax=Armillaria luteobubalina TaxID=153913 RepID=A0AA39QM60_9AGAR|nr:cytoplasmic protein [Armillaria luteobubalina]
MSTLLKVFKALYNLFCGVETSKPQEQYSPPEHHQPVSQPLPHQPSPQYPPAHRPQKYEDDNQKNQQNEYYIDLRARANKEGDEMARCFSESHEAYNRGDGAGAKELSNQGKKHQQKMEQLNKEASDWIFVENNRDSKPGEIDLHGLYVKEAIARTDIALDEAKRRGDTEIRLIVGKGLHSKGGAAKIRPAIEELMHKHQLVAELDPSNSGVLVVEFNGARGRGVGPDEIARRLDREDGGCIVM